MRDTTPILDVPLTEDAVIQFLLAFAASARATLGVAEPVDSMMLLMVGMTCALRRPEVAHALLGVVSPPYAESVQGDSDQAGRDIERRHKRLDAQGVEWQGRRANKTGGEIGFLGGYGSTTGQIGSLPDRPARLAVVARDGLHETDSRGSDLGMQEDWI